MRKTTLAMFSFFTLLIGVFAYGQASLTGYGVRAKIPFAFSVGNIDIQTVPSSLTVQETRRVYAIKVLPAGEYYFVPETNLQDIYLYSPGEGFGRRGSAIVEVLSRIAVGTHTAPQTAYVVFDKVGDTYTLSELWSPGEDGFLLNATKEKHQHEIVNVPVSK